MSGPSSCIEGVIIKKPVKHLDERGFLCETYRLDELPEQLHPAMSYVSFTEPGISRGPHEHRDQTDIMSFLGPGNFVVKLWDNRKDSNTYGNYLQLYAGQDNPFTIIVPPGVVHGYKNISLLERGMVINHPNRLYRGVEKRGKVDEIRHEEDQNSPFKLDN